MKFLFVCGSMEPGKDGVGDYTRRLAIQLKRLGNCVAVIGIDDRYLETSKVEKQYSEDNYVEVFRIPFHGNIKEANSWIRNFNAEVISLQYVPYSFSNKGIHFDLLKKLEFLRTSRQIWHIMFHELWIGMEHHDKWKELLVGWLQKKTILRTIKILKPDLITTQTNLYISKLKSAGLKAIKLPLFSNIPFVNAQVNRNNDETIIVLFGNIHPNNLFQKFAADALKYQNISASKQILWILGRSNANQSHLKNIWNQNGLEAQILGELDTDSISKIFQQSTVGLSTNSHLKIEKSGSIVAMLEHGLKVISISNDSNEVPNSFESTILNYSKTGYSDCIRKSKIRSKVYSGIERSTLLFQELIQDSLQQ